jgi:regulatory protein
MLAGDMHATERPDDAGRSPETAQRTRKRRGPKKATPEYLEKAALAYLERYASSTANLRRVLMGKVARSARHHGTDADAGARAVEALLTRLQESGLLDDGTYAEGRAVTLHRMGHSLPAIRMRLRQKGVDPDTIENALERLTDEADDPDLAAALRYARKRRIGPYRRVGRAENRERDMAALARKGFSPDLCQRIVDAEDPADLEAEAGAKPGPLG